MVSFPEQSELILPLVQDTSSLLVLVNFNMFAKATTTMVLYPCSEFYAAFMSSAQALYLFLGSVQDPEGVPLYVLSELRLVIYTLGPPSGANSN